MKTVCIKPNKQTLHIKASAILILVVTLLSSERKAVSEHQGGLLRNINLHTTCLWGTESQTMSVQCRNTLFVIPPLTGILFIKFRIFSVNAIHQSSLNNKSKFN